MCPGCWCSVPAIHRSHHQCLQKGNARACSPFPTEVSHPSGCLETLWCEAVHFRMGKERKYRFWCPWKRGTSKAAHAMTQTGRFFGCQQLPAAAAAPDAKATGSCHSCSLHRPGGATADNTLQVFSPRTKALFSGCREGRSLLAGWKMAFLDGNIWLQ